MPFFSWIMTSASYVLQMRTQTENQCQVDLWLALGKFNGSKFTFGR